MKRRYNCVDGKAGKPQRAVLRLPIRQGERLRPVVASSYNEHEPAPAGPRPSYPESPWDKRLRHPWVWAYRRSHGDPGGGR